MKYEPIAYAFQVVLKDGTMKDVYFATYDEAKSFAVALVAHLNNGIPYGEYHGSSNVRYVFSMN